MPVIERIRIESWFKYLWLKYIDEVDLDKHCAKTFIGPYSKKISPSIRDAAGIDLSEHVPKSGYIYLCGVSDRYVNNFHLAMQVSPNHSFYTCEKGVEIWVKGAIRVPILPDYAKLNSHKFQAIAAFRTCRNWQFANYLEFTKFQNVGEANGKTSPEN